MQTMPSGGAAPSVTPGSISAVITVCSHRKTHRPTPAATAVSLPMDSQTSVQTAWIERIRTLPLVATAGTLYAGRGFGLATEAAKIAKSRLFVLSAGLGLVPSDRNVPAYGLTVSGGHAESVAARITGEFALPAWFSALLAGPHSVQWTDVFGRDSGRVLIALSRPYAKMVGESLCGLPPLALAHLRIFGASVSSALPTALHPAIAPYDHRLDTILPGTRTDFSQRALLHFVRSVAIGHTMPDREADFAAVNAALRGTAAPEWPRRLRRSDDEILELISARLRSQSGIARILRALRDEEGVACEQSRFGRLYRAALERRVAA